eukprot:8806491-Pyramimonas_sp.AAC.1
MRLITRKLISIAVEGLAPPPAFSSRKACYTSLRTISLIFPLRAGDVALSTTPSPKNARARHLAGWLMKPRSAFGKSME